MTAPHIQSDGDTRQPVPMQVAHDLASACDPRDAQSSLNSWPVRTANWCMEQYPVLATECSSGWGLVLQGFEQVWLDTGDRKYLEYIQNTIDWLFGPEGNLPAYRPGEYDLDNLGPGRSLFRLYQETGEARYQQAIELVRKPLRGQPRTSEGGFWHRRDCPFQMWLDDVYMAGPFYAEYGKIFSEPAAFDDAAHQILLIERHTRDPRTGLFYRAWDESKMQEWANPQTGCSPQFSARAMGRYAMGIVEVLDFLPASHQARDRIITILARMIRAITLAKDPAAGLWHQVLDGSSNDASELDAAASCMFVYAMVKGSRMGYLASDCLDSAQKGFTGIVERLIKCVEFGDANSFAQRVEECDSQVCTSSRESHLTPASATTALTAIGAFMLASTEIQRQSNQD